MIVKFKNFINEKLTHDKFKLNPKYDGEYIILSKGQWILYIKEDYKNLKQLIKNVNNIFNINYPLDVQDFDDYINNLNLEYPNILIFKWKKNNSFINFYSKQDFNPDFLISKEFIDSLILLKKELKVNTLNYNDYKIIWKEEMDIEESYDIDNLIQNSKKYRNKKLPDIIYHGTCTKNLMKILSQGIKPVPELSNFKRTNIKHNRYTFYSSSKYDAMFYAYNSAEQTNSFPIIFEIDTEGFDKNLISFDYDFYSSYVGKGNEYFDNIMKNMYKIPDTFVLDKIYNKNIGSTFSKFSYQGSIYPKYISKIYYLEDYSDKSFNNYVEKDEFKDFLEMVEYYRDMGYSMDEQPYLNINSYKEYIEEEKEEIEDEEFEEEINESKISNDNEYFKTIEKFYNRETIKHIKQGEEIAKNLCKGDIKTEISDNNNLIVRWMEDDNYILILGIVAKEGKIRISDYIDIKKWINLCVSGLLNGKTILSSPNELSEPIIKKIIKEAEKIIELDVKISNASIPSNINTRNWKNYLITPIT